jgi:EpsI family protein
VTSRRDLLIGAACLVAGGGAYALQPRRRASLLGTAKLSGIVPAQFGDWTSTDVSNLVAPSEADSLAARLYGQTVERVYRQGDTGAEVMMLLAWGDTQTNELQLHRPEVCYPAFGFTIGDNHPVLLTIARGVDLPARHLVATAPDRRETIAYWTRLGEYTPVSENQQRLDRVRTALHGVIADGLLARFSVMNTDPASAYPTLDQFIAAFIGATAPGDRPALIGTARARALASAAA